MKNGKCDNCGDCVNICNGEMRADGYQISSMADKVDGSGYLKIKGTFTRAGIFRYKNPDGTWRRELRHPDDVMRADSMDTLKLIPIAPLIDHTMSMLGIQPPNKTENFKSIGVTGENISKTADAALDGTLAIHDKPTIKELLELSANEQPLPQISAAYALPNGVDATPGYFDGSKWGIESGEYDVRQLPPFNYGHVTLLKEGRAGSRCQVRADMAQDSNSKQEPKTMSKKRIIPALEIGAFRADEIEIEDNADTQALLAQRARLAATLQKEITRADIAEGELSVVKKDYEELKKTAESGITKEEYRADMKESLELMEKCKAAGIEAKDDVSPRALKLLLIEKFAKEDLQRADADDGYLEGVFSGIERDWKHRVSRMQTDAGIKFFDGKLDAAPEDSQGFKDYSVN